MKRRSVVELLEMTEILRENYNSESLKAAENELFERNLSDSELNAAKEIINKRIQKQKNKKHAQAKAKDILSQIDDFIDPIKNRTSSGIIKLIAVGLTIIYLYPIVKDWELTLFMLQEPSKWDSSVLEYVLPLVLFPIGIFGFWSLKKYGWIIITFLYTYKTSSSLFGLLLEIKWSYEHDGSQPQIFNTLDEAFGYRGVLYGLATLIIVSGFLYVINRKSITKTFEVSRLIQFSTIGVAALFTSILWISIF